MTTVELGQKIRARRKIARITQAELAELAELAGLAVHTMSDIESGKGNPTFEVISKICHVLGLEIRFEPRNPGE